jgi:hypothetical protein
MTSWLKLNVVKPLDKKSSFMFETTDTGFCFQFNQYLYAVLYAAKEDVPLVVNDTSNAVSIRYPLIKNTFVTPPEISFVDSQVVSATSLKKRVVQIRNFLNGTRPEELRNAAKGILPWNPSLLQKLGPILDAKYFPGEFDVGVHIRAGDKITSGEMKNIPIEQYIRAVKAYQTKSGKKKLDIFVMSDSSLKLDEFIKKKDAAWTVHTIAAPSSMQGHVQRDFNASSSGTRMNAYLNFVAELFLMQQVPHIVCTFSSQVGRFLYLTSENEVVSVDDPKFFPY